MQWFLSNEGLIQVALVFVILGYAIQLPLRAGVFSFAGAGFFALSAYLTGILVIHGWNPVVATLLSVVVSAALGLGLSMILGRLRSLYLAMATLAFIFIVQLVAESTPIAGGSVGLLGIPLNTSTWFLALVVLVVSVGMWLLERGRFSRITEAVRTDEALAGSLGVSLVRHRNIVLVLSSALGAVAGSLFALTFSVVIPDQVGFDLVVNILTILVVGGSRRWIGVIIGSFLVAWLPEWLAFLGSWRPVVQGLIIVAFAVLAPRGVVGIAGALIGSARVRRSARETTEVPSDVVA